MILKQELILEKFSAFLDKFLPKEQNLFHLGVVVQKYFYMAEIQLTSFEEAVVKTFRENEWVSSSVYSYTAGVYAMLRTCLEASRKLADEFESRTRNSELTEHRESYKKEMGDIIDIANDFVKHPTNGESPLFCEPGGYDSSGDVTFYQYSASEPSFFETPKVNPRRDLKKVFDYLEGLAQIYIKLLSLPEMSDKSQ